MSLLNENVVTLAKSEVTYGVDITPVGADAIKTSAVKCTPFEAAYIARNLDKPNSGADQELVTGIHAMLEFKVELVGSGTLGTAPAFGKLIKACRWGETVVAVTSVTYKPLRTAIDSLSIYFYMDGQLHKMLGARGTFTIEFDSQGIPYLAFKFWGLYVDPATSAAPAALTGWTAFQLPAAIDFANTPVPTLHGFSGVFKGFKFDAGSDVKYFNNPGEQLVQIMRHACTGSINLQAPILSTKNYFNAVKANTLGSFKVEHGTVSATKWFLESVGGRAQILRPRYGDDEGRSMIEADLKFIPDVGGDEIELRFAAT